MSHEITATDSLFSVREMPWHGLGHVLPDYPTREVAQQLAHNWEPIREPIFGREPVITDDGDLTVEYVEIPDEVRIVRSDNRQHLGVVPEQLPTITNTEMYDLAEEIQGGPASDVLWETGGSLNGGRKVWLLLRLAEPLQIKGDPNGTSLPFYLLQNEHTGKGAFSGSATQIRPICANTIRQADMDAKAHGTEFTFRHTKNMRDRIEQAREALQGWRESLDEYRRLAEFMLDQPVSHHAQVEFLQRFIPEPISTMTSDRVKNNIAKAREQWTEVYDSVTCEGIRETAWGLVQASSEWSEHVRRANSAETRFRRAVIERNTILTDAKNLALEAAQAS
jgi:phage/plasmid-like protein (TIGR03299 family)